MKRRSAVRWMIVGLIAVRELERDPGATVIHNLITSSAVPEIISEHGGTPGLRVVSPSTPNDAYWMIQDAIASPDPVIFLEPKAKYWMKGEVDTSARALPLHASRLVRRGTDVTLVGHGAMVTTLLQAAALAESEGTSCEVVDVRSLSPIDYGPILDSVRRTGRMVYAQEAPGNVSVGSEVAATTVPPGHMQKL